MIENPFYSTINFFDALRDISIMLNKVSFKLEYLQESLKRLNAQLPASVYIPFNSIQIRNCSILHIPVPEAVVFSTKERAPFKIAIEVYCPYQEIKITKNPNIFKADSSFSLFSDNSTSTNEIGLMEFKELPDSLLTTPVLNVVQEEEFVYRSFSCISDGVSAVYGCDTEENDKYLQENLEAQEIRVKYSSPYGNLSTWKLVNLIVKSGDDLRQEQLAIQLLTFFKQSFDEKKLGIWLYPYDIIATHKDCGIIECVSDAVSIDYLKKALPNERTSLHDYFVLQMGKPESSAFRTAQKEFMKSLAGYSLACYLLQIKDRHNGNILIDSFGHIVHIDFGFMLSNSPGGNINFESAPFKLTEEFERILGGRRSTLFSKFRALCVKGYTALREKAEQIILMVEMMRTGSGNNLPCFVGGETVVSELRNRLLPKKEMSSAACKKYINSLIDLSLDHWSTRCYDRVQYCCQGIFY